MSLSDVVASYSAADFRRRALRERAEPEAGFYGDHRLNPDYRDFVVREDSRAAAVLIAAVDHPEGASLILTKRTDTLRQHAGQIAFPGGRIDPEDPTPEWAALREAEEEIGLPPQSVEVLGRLPDYWTGSGFRIAPVIGIVQPGFTLQINPAEVDAAFEVPLAFLMDPQNHGRQSVVFDKGERFFYEMTHGTWRIWGVTAGLIRTLYERLYD
jgi:8-oxo-dGTP pyrophosphatase MutT (NUDIX family)